MTSGRAQNGGGAVATRAAGAASAPPHQGRRVHLLRPGIVVVGASTGGPQALLELLGKLAATPILVPVCVTLHMPPGLMPLVVASLARQGKIKARIVEAPCRLEVGVVYFAPGDRHLCFERHPERVDVTLAAAPSPTHCKPAIDRMFTEAAQAFGAQTLGIVLSGMGEDGLAGAEAIHAAGGTLLVQDKPSSAVWGMPGVVAKAGLAAAVLPPADIARDVLRRLTFVGPRR